MQTSAVVFSMENFNPIHCSLQRRRSGPGGGLKSGQESEGASFKVCEESSSHD